jgi:N-methylhydantoinase B
VIETLKPGETVTNLNPGGGGYGNPYERPIEKVLRDVQNGLVSVAGAREDYGVVITDAATRSVDMAATRRLREEARAAAS